MKIRHVLLHLVCSAAFVFFAEAALAATAGHIQFVNGDVQVINPSGITHALQKGDAINEGDTISSAKEASAQVKMADGGFIAVRQETQLKFDSFKVALKQGDPENSFFSLVKGSFRAVTGLIGRVNKQNYKITTPVATIGIRGTDHETAFVPNALPGVPAGAYSKVNVGETSLTTGAGTINVKPNQMGYAGGLNQPPKLVPINTSLFTVAAAPASGAKKEDKKDKEDKGGGQQGQQTAQNGTKEDKGGKEGEGSNGSGGGEPIRDTAVVDNTSKSGAATSTAPATTTTVTTAETAVTTVSAPPQTTIPVTATNNSLTLDTTNQTVTAGGSTVSVQNGTYGIDAKTAADAAKAAADAANAVAAAASTINTQVTALTSANTAPATSAIATANGTITAASPLVTSATAITPVGAATAASNAATAQAAATAAASKASAAQAALTANGAFADSLAGPANTATASANTALQAANSSLQAAAATVTAQNTALTTAQTSASTALTAANTNLTAANASLTTANTNNASIASAQSAASGLASQVATAASLAQAAANAALAAAAQVISLQTAGDFTGAAAQLAIAQQQQTIAQQQLVIAQNASTTLSSQLTAATTAQTNANNAVTAAVSAANTAAANAGTGTTGAQSYVSAAQTAATSASSALATTSSLLPTVTSNAPIVAANAPIAAYYNPKVAGGSFIGATMLSVPASGGGFNAAFPPATLPQLNTAYVLDGSGNLAEMRNSQFRVQANQNGGWLTPNIIGTSGADIKWSGGTGADAFNLSDNSIYLGRWSGAIVTVTDNANTANVYTYTPADNIWLVALPPPTGYVQTLVGTTTYTKAGNTTPVDAFGNLGVLNSATLTANFTSQLVTAGVNLTMGAASPMGGTYAVTGANLPINGGGFDIYSGSSQPGTLTISCSGTCAATGTTGYSAELGGGFAGTAAASAAMSYAIWPTTAATSPVTDAVQGFVAFTAATAPTGPTVAAYTATSTAVAYTGSYGGGFNFIAAPGEVTPLSNPTTFTENYGGGSGFRTDVLTGTSTATPPVTTANGISFGVWDTVTTVSTHEHHLITPNNGGSYPQALNYFSKTS